ncbi:hypothetical protein [Huaxiibacter chinensis]|nr:hypothetical protein [Huaxiibacter chinensis]
MFTRLSLAMLVILACLWIVLIFDFGNVMQHISSLLISLDLD